MRSRHLSFSVAGALLAAVICLRIHAQTPSSPPHDLPSVLFETDLNKGLPPSSSTWIWNGEKYIGSWIVFVNNAFFQATGEMKIKSFDGGRHLVMQRTDESGVFKGLTATYSGDWDGNKIVSGTGDYSFNNLHGAFTWTAVSVPHVGAVEASKLAMSNPSPIYPGRNFHLSGLVRVEFTIRPDGSVSDVASLGPSNETLAGACKDAVSHWKYHPYLKDGQPIAIRTTTAFKFELELGVQNIPE